MKAKIKVWEGVYKKVEHGRFVDKKTYYWSVRVPRRYRVAWIATGGHEDTFESALDSARACIDRLKEEYESKTPKVYKESVEL